MYGHMRNKRTVFAVMRLTRNICFVRNIQRRLFCALFVVFVGRITAEQENRANRYKTQNRDNKLFHKISMLNRF